MRVIFWLTVWALSLFMLEIYASYDDGLTINLKGWPQSLGRLWKRIKEKRAEQ